MPLTDTTCRNAKPSTAPKKLSDAGGLHLLVTTGGSKLWRWSYRFNKKQKTLSFGAYPAVTLNEARIKRERAKTLLAKGIDPSIQRKLDRLSDEASRDNTFVAIANELLEKFKNEKQTNTTLKKKRWLLEFAISEIGSRPITEVSTVELLAVLKKIEKRGRHETAVRLRSLLSMVFRFAIASGRAATDPAADLRGALVTPKVRHHAALLDPKKIGGLLRLIDGLEGSIVVKGALKLIALLFVRPGELRYAEWNEISFEDAVWRIPAARMKMKREHRVPLAPQALKILNELKKITGSSPLLFPSSRSWHRPISENTMNAVLRRLGYGKDEMTSHGFRSIASTHLNEMGWSRDAVERQLAHQEGNEVRRAYMHAAEFWSERVRMMTAWADHLDTLRCST